MTTEVPLLSANAFLCWEKESTFKSAPAASTWRSFGNVNDWEDLGPKNAVFRDHVAGGGREAATIGFEGATYDGIIGPYQVIDPENLGFFWGQEVNAPTALGGGFYRHTATPTTRGILPSRSIQMRDVQGGAAASPVTDKTTFLGAITNRLVLRGEAPGEDGSGGRFLASEEVLAHDDDDAVADKGVALDTEEPYRYHHGDLTFWGELGLRIEDWEFSGDNQCRYNFYWRSDSPRRPTEAPPDTVVYDFNATVVADGEKYTTGGGVDKLLREIVQERLLGAGTIKMTRTANQDEFQVNLTDIALTQALKRRSLGGGAKTKYVVRGHVRTSTLQWIDTNSSRYFPS